MGGKAMCGIIGIVGQGQVAPLIVDALKRLEYRGYDSAGVATIEKGELGRRRAEGKLINLERRLKEEPLGGTIGIGHTRWATHGVPNETNAHPHFSNGVAIVHNGIIENFAELRDELIRDGYAFASQTDTEVVAHLVARELAKGLKPVEAAHAALKRLSGAFALAIMFKGDEDLIVGARNGRLWPLGMAMARCFWDPTPSRSLRSPIRSPISRTATGRWCAATASPSSTSTAKRSSASGSSRCRPASWSTRAIDAILWRRKSMNSPK